ncbi:MAG: hypothetical protein ACTSRP_00930 [Candidatus Helarchaeota archaeon]
MTEKHNVSFFGKNQGLILITKSFKDKVHLNFIRKKEDGSFQKLNEGLHIQINVLEICKIAKFLEEGNGSINIIHKHPNSSDVKNFRFEYRLDKDRKSKILFIKAKLDNDPNFPKFSKPLNKEETRLFKKLWIHLEEEKIAHYETTKI